MAEGIQIGEAFVRIRPSTQGFEQETQSQLTGLGNSLKSAVGPLAAAFGVGAIFKEGIDRLGEMQQVAAQTGAVLRSTGGIANVTAEEVKGLADEIHNYSGKDNEAIQAAENLLLTFRHVRNEAGEGNDIFTRATQLATDLSVAWGQDLHSSAIQLGKALEDPISGLTALRRVGVQFTQDQKDQIKALVDSGQTMEAQKVILNELQIQVGGSAAAYGQTLPGQIEKAKDSFEDLTASVVSGAAPALVGILGIANDVAQGFTALPDPIRNVALVLGLVAGAAALIGPSAEVAAEGLAAETVAADGAAAATSAAAASNGTLAATMAALTSPTLLATAGITAALYALQQFNKGVADAKAAADALRPALEHKIDTSSYNDIIGKYNTVGDQINQLGDTVANSHAPWDADYRAQVNAYRNSLIETNNETASFINRVNEFSRASGLSNQAATAYFQSFAAAGVPIKDTATALEFYRTGVTATAEAEREGASATNLSEEAWKARNDEEQKALDHAGQLTDAQSKVTDSSKSVADAQRAVTDEAKAYTDIARNQTTAQLDLADAQERLNDLQNQGAKNSRDQRGAALDVRTAQLDLADAQKKAAENPGDERAQIAAEEAQLRLETATQRVQDVEKGISDQSKNIERARLDVAAAEDKVTAARQAAIDQPAKQAAAEDTLSQALINQRLAIADLVVAQADLEGGHDAAAIKAYEQITQLEGLRDTLDPGNPLRQNIQGLIDNLSTVPQTKEIEFKINAIINTPGVGQETFDRIVQAKGLEATLKLFGIIPAAYGGPVSAGRVYRVGEQGPELFNVNGQQLMIPGENGSITPNSQLPTSQPGQVIHLTVNNNGGQPLRPSDISRELQAAAYRRGVA